MDEWSTDITLEFLHLYEMESVIWDPKNPTHKDRNEIADAWKRIRDALSIECSVKMLKRKKESLMASFRTLFTKVKESRESSSGEVFKPCWFAYETMENFLKTVYQPRKSNSMEVNNFFFLLLIIFQ